MCAAMCSPGGVGALGGGDTKAACTGRGPTQGWGGHRARAERTKNMRYMVVTLDVSQFDMSALKIRML